jgi:hypothetical protein
VLEVKKNMLLKHDEAPEQQTTHGSNQTLLEVSLLSVCLTIFLLLT